MAREKTDSIKIGGADRKELVRRRREMLLALGAVGLIIILTWVELKFMSGDSYLFLALFNLNFILLLLVLFIVVRNGVKLLLERRRNVLGSKLRTRLVLAFISLSLVPTALMFVLALKFVQTSVDYWFKNQVETSMEQALDVGQVFYSSVQARLDNAAVHLREGLGKRLPSGEAALRAFLTDKKREHGLSLIGWLGPERQERVWIMDETAKDAWGEVRARVNWPALDSQSRFWVSLAPSPTTDYVIGILPLDGGKGGYLALGQTIGRGMTFKLDQIVRGIDDYKKLKTLKYPLKVALYLILGVMSLLIVFGAMWFGFRLAKELSAPVQALALGTQRIARGDLSFRLEDKSDDELGFLVQSFNSMAGDLELSRDGLTQANIRLGEQNRELEQRGQYMAVVLNNVTSGVISLDPEGRISTVNRAAEAMLGLDGGLLIGRKPQDLLNGEYLGILDEIQAQLQANPHALWQRQIELTLGARELKLLVNVVALRSGAEEAGGTPPVSVRTGEAGDPEGEDAGLVAVFEDISELEKMQRLAAWREVAKRIAHEIKNPLTPIKLSAQRLERKFGSDVDDPAFAQCTGLIVRQVEYLQQMVKEFSTFAKLPEVVLRRDDLTPLLREVVSLFEHSHSRIEWALHLDSNLPELKFDREGMRRVFVNILTNACEALDDQVGGRVDISAAFDESFGRVRVKVADNGPGVEPEERSRLFEPYFSKKKGGTGLGLTIVKSVVSDHHGLIRIKPNYPKGTTFIVDLPSA